MINYILLIINIINIRSWNFDLRLYRRIQIHIKSKIPLASSNISAITRKINANKRQGNILFILKVYLFV